MHIICKSCGEIKDIDLTRDKMKLLDIKNFNLSYAQINYMEFVKMPIKIGARSYIYRQDAHYPNHGIPFKVLNSIIMGIKRSVFNGIMMAG